MALAAPTLKGFPNENANKEIVVELSKLKDRLEVSIPDSAYRSPLDEAFAMLEADNKNREWRGDAVPAGHYNEETDDVERRSDLTVYVPKKELESRVNQTVMLSYQIGGETEPQTSSSVTLRIEP